MTSLFPLAAALAAIAAPLPAAAAPASAASAPVAPARIGDHPHIRTTIHGTSGPVVVLIPGLSTPGAVWNGTVDALSGTHRLLVVEVKGFDGARTPANERPGLLDGIVADLAADIRARRLQPALLVGHSLGGLLTLKAGLAHPGIAAKLLVIDALPFFGTVLDPKATVASVTPQAVQMRDMMLAQAEMLRSMAKGPPPKGQPGAMAMSELDAARVAGWAMKAEPTVVAQALYEDILTDLRTDIAAIRVPVTVLYQAHQDPALALKRYTTDYAALPQATLTPVGKTSHFIMLDQPAFTVATIRAMTE